MVRYQFLFCKFNMKNRVFTAVVSALVWALGTGTYAAESSTAQVYEAVSAAVRPTMEKHHIPGMAVALVLGEATYVFNYGVADVDKQTPVSDATMFEVGSISKTFTATLATYAETVGALHLSDAVEKHLPKLTGTDFGRIQLLHLGTHTVGGMPLQVPDGIQDSSQLLAYLRDWQPAYPVGTMRTYANPSIGMLGWITAQSLGQDFSTAVTQKIFEPLGLNNTYLRVPAHKMEHYAWGYNAKNQAVRVNSGLLDSEAYGIKTTAKDLATFVKANMGMLPVERTLQTALSHTHKPYFSTGQMTQNLIWEEYAMPVTLSTLQDGNSPSQTLNPTPVRSVSPESVVRNHVWVNKTGATNGFDAYVAYVPAKNFGVVLLANKNYPNAARVEIAHRIYQTLKP